MDLMLDSPRGVRHCLRQRVGPSFVLARGFPASRVRPTLKSPFAVFFELRLAETKYDAETGCEPGEHGARCGFLDRRLRSHKSSARNIP